MLCLPAVNLRAQAGMYTLSRVHILRAVYHSCCETVVAIDVEFKWKVVEYVDEQEPSEDCIYTISKKGARDFEHHGSQSKQPRLV